MNGEEKERPALIDEELLGKIGFHVQQPGPTKTKILLEMTECDITQTFEGRCIISDKNDLVAEGLKRFGWQELSWGTGRGWVYHILKVYWGNAVNCMIENKWLNMSSY